MDNITLEDLYKKAVKEKYEEVKNGDDFFFLNPPTRGKLNKLCWEKFTTNNPHSNDLNVFNSLLGISFDINSQRKFKKETNPFRPIENFFKGDSDPDKIEVVDMAAILVDYQPRPFNKFRREIDPEDLEIFNKLKNNNKSDTETKFENLIDEVEREEFTASEATFDVEKKESAQSKESELTEIEELEQLPETETIIVKMFDEPKSSTPKNINLFINVREKILKRFKERLKHTAIATILIFALIASVVYFAFFKNHCMQWSGDRYEVVDCSENNGNNLNEIIPLDKNILDFRKVKACDTTKCFLTNGEAFLWYGKTANGIDVFNNNGNGRHPENKKDLHPMSKYMFDKYLKGKLCE